MPTTATRRRRSRSGTLTTVTTRSTRPPARSGCAPPSTTATTSLFPNQFVNVRLLVEAEARRHAGAERRHSANRERHVRLPGEAGLHRDGAADHGGSHGRRRYRNHQRAGARRRGGDDRRRQAAGRQQGQRAIPPTHRPGAAKAGGKAEDEASESVPDVHPPAGRDLAADGRHPAGRRRRLQATARLRAAARWTIRPFR